MFQVSGPSRLGKGSTRKTDKSCPPPIVGISERIIP
jgi:hypothetical protein